MIFKFIYQERGGHTHVRMFAGSVEGALGKCGDLVFRNEEWQQFMQNSGEYIWQPEEDYPQRGNDPTRAS